MTKRKDLQIIEIRIPGIYRQVRAGKDQVLPPLHRAALNQVLHTTGQRKIGFPHSKGQGKFKSPTLQG